MTFEVNEAGVEALNALASRMNEIREEILSIAGTMQSEAESNSNALGPHADTLIEVCEEVKRLTEDSSSPIETLSNSCKNLATKYEDIIANDPFSGLGN
jgi:gas vesicle protein